ncbi:MAG: response regulator transcription factor [Sulfurovaceae bacterium]|nr:response regulator transcription factor [Sulfurovaceae bacterium]
MLKEKIEILIIEDEEDILELVEYLLKKEGYKTAGFLSTEHVQQFLDEESPSLIIADRNLPNVEGSEFISNLRDQGYTIPVIFLSAKDKQSDIEDGFERGGDDYITKPFQPKEFILRVNALLRRTGTLASQDIIRYKEITLNRTKKIVSVKSEDIALTQFECDLLYFLIQNAGKTIEREILHDTLWQDKMEHSNYNAMNVAVSRLKKKIDPEGKLGYFHAVWGIGYKFE